MKEKEIKEQIKEIIKNGKIQDFTIIAVSKLDSNNTFLYLKKNKKR